MFVTLSIGVFLVIVGILFSTELLSAIKDYICYRKFRKLLVICAKLDTANGTVSGNSIHMSYSPLYKAHKARLRGDNWCYEITVRIKARHAYDCLSVDNPYLAVDYEVIKKFIQREILIAGKQVPDVHVKLTSDTGLEAFKVIFYQ